MANGKDTSLGSGGAVSWDGVGSKDVRGPRIGGPIEGIEQSISFLLHLSDRMEIQSSVKFLSLQIFTEQCLPYAIDEQSNTARLLLSKSPYLLSTACCLVASKILQGPNHLRALELWDFLVEEAEGFNPNVHRQTEMLEVELCLMEVIMHSKISLCRKITSDHVLELFEICQSSMIACERYLHLSTCFLLLDTLHLGNFGMKAHLSNGGSSLASAIILVSMAITVPKDWSFPLPMLSFLSALTDESKQNIQGLAVDILQHIRLQRRVLLSPEVK